MQKWEYTFVSLQISSKDKEWKPTVVNGQELKNWENDVSLYEFSNKMGNDGWELVTAPFSIGSNEYFWRLVFKRPKS